MAEPILAVRDLSVDARTPEGLRPVLEDVSFTLHPGETLMSRGGIGLGQVADGAFHHALAILVAEAAIGIDSSR